jgi:hypothetical protein
MTQWSTKRATPANLNVALHPHPTQVLVGSGAACLLALGFFAVVWLHWESLFRAHPLLALPFVCSLVIGPALLFVSLRRMTETGVCRRLVLSAGLSASALVLTALTFLLSLRHLAGV